MKSMTAFLTFIVFLLLVGCGKAAHDLYEDYGPLKPRSAPRPEYLHDPDLQAFADQYLDEMAKAGVSTKYYGRLLRLEYVDAFDDKEPANTIGLCNKYTDQDGVFTTIKIKRVETNSFINRAIVFHEMGHCVNNLKHSDERGSIMYPELTMNTQYYVENWDSLVTGLVQYIKDQGQDK